MSRAQASKPQQRDECGQTPPARVVLIADDEPHVRLTIEYMLRRLEGVEVISVGDGVSAIKHALERRPDLILLDVIIPEIDGYTVCRTIRDELAEACGTIWLITGRYSAFDEDQAEVVGADRFISKPFDPDGFLNDAAAALGLSHPGDQRY